MSTPNSPDARDAAFDEKVRSVLQDRVVEAPAPASHLFAEAAVGPMARRSLLAAAVVLTAAVTWFLSPEGTEATGPEPAEAPAFKAPAERVDLEPVEQTVEPQGVSVEVDTEGEEAPAVEEVVEVVEVVEAEIVEPVNRPEVPAEVAEVEEVEAPEPQPAAEIEDTPVVAPVSEAPASEEVRPAAPSDLESVPETAPESPAAPTLTLPLTLPSGGGS